MKAKVTPPKGIENAIVKIGIRLSKEAAEYGAKVARELYDNVEYDGRVDNIVIDTKQTKTGYSLRASGPQVVAIEYGADGSVGVKVLQSKKTGENFWFFPASSSDPFRNGGGMKRETRYKVTPYARKTIKVDGKMKMAPMSKADLEQIQKKRYKGKLSLGEVFKKEIEENGPLYRTAEKYRKTHGGYTMEKRYAEKTPRTDGKLSNKYAYSFGNEPQYVIRDTKDKIREFIKDRNAGH